MSYTLLNMDCMDFMRNLPDNAYSLAIVDPPYAVGASDGKFGGGESKPSMVSGKRNAKHYANHNKTPDADYFTQLFRVSKNQIIWGLNYYPQHLSHSGAIVWDKMTTGPLSDCELAYQSFNKLVTKYTQAWTGFNKGGEKTERCHPNQKPVRLYEWLLTNYAKPGDTILDTHGGSMSSVIACINLGFDITCIEKDPDYFEAAKQRIENHQK